jgi:hypothetical protein
MSCVRARLISNHVSGCYRNMTYHYTVHAPATRTRESNHVNMHSIKCYKTKHAEFDYCQSFCFHSFQGALQLCTVASSSFTVLTREPYFIIIPITFIPILIAGAAMGAVGAIGPTTGGGIGAGSARCVNQAPCIALNWFGVNLDRHALYDMKLSNGSFPGSLGQESRGPHPKLKSFSAGVSEIQSPGGSHPLVNV